MANEVIPLVSAGCIALICAMVRTFQMRTIPLVSLEINRFALAIKLVIPH